MRSKRQFLAGAARREITPPVGSALSGFVARLRPSTGISGRLYARALVLSNSGSNVVLIQLDLLGIGRWHVEEIRRLCRRLHHVPPECVMISTSHTHSGPGLVAVRGCQMADTAYHWSVVRKTVEAVNEAFRRISPATMRQNTVPFRLGINRRQTTRHGVVLGLAPNKPAPKTLSVAHFTMTDGASCILFSHAAHPYILGGDSTLISADFPGFACEQLERSAGTTAMFLNGCAGDIAPMRAFEGVTAAREEGRRLAGAVQEALEHAVVICAVPTLGRSEQIHLPHAALPTIQKVRSMTRDQGKTVRPQERGCPLVAQKIKKAMKDWALAIEEVIAGEHALEPVFSEVQILRVGGLLLVGISGEPFYETGQRIAGRMEDIWTLGYCNEFTGYLPTAKAFAEGGYEVTDSYRYLSTWQLAPSSERKLVRAARDLITKEP